VAELRVGSATDTGRIRPENEDNFLVTTTAFVVADGMGGHEAGEVASQIAVDGIREVRVKEITEERLVISIDRQQRVFLGNDPININEIPARLKEKLKDPERMTIYLRSDENVPFGAFATVMDAVKQSGITNVSIVTEPLESNKKR
jgi:biopolymer transport protein ExbD